MSDLECDLEFLDLTGVDKQERLTVRETLRNDNPKIDFPWTTSGEKIPFEGIKQSKKDGKPNITKPVSNSGKKQKKRKKEPKQDEITKSVFNPDSIHPTVSLPNGNDFRQPPPPVVPPIVPEPYQANPVLYANTFSPPPYNPQIYAIPQSNINNVIHSYPDTTYPYTISSQSPPYTYPVTPQVPVQNNMANTYLGYPPQVPAQDSSISTENSHSNSWLPQENYSNGVVNNPGFKNGSLETAQPVFNEKPKQEWQTYSAPEQNCNNGMVDTLPYQNNNVKIVPPVVKDEYNQALPMPSVDNQNYKNGLADNTPYKNFNTETVQPIVKEAPPMVSTDNQRKCQRDVPQPNHNLAVVIENGVKGQLEKETVSSPPVAKSWASLFHSKGSNGVSSEATNGDLKKDGLDKAVNKGGSNEVCPIKHPRRSQFIDPDSYRMGEFLSNYSVDGRAVSLKPRGLINRSNYCYVNSILQALIACPPLYNLMSDLAQNISPNEKRQPTPVIDGMCRFVKEFKHLPAYMRVNNRRVEGKQQKNNQGTVINTDIPFEPAWVHKMLNGIRSDLIAGRQEDAEEFLGCLLNGLNDEMLELIKLIRNDCDESLLPNNSESENEPDKEWKVMGPKNKGSVTRRTDFGKTPISDIFGGLLRSRIHRAGDHVTENIQPFFTLQLNIGKVNTVREALEALVTKYQLEGLTSSKTNEEVEAWQQVMLDELPVVLVLHLKCFDFQWNGCTKIVKALEFPIDLKIDSKLLSSSSKTYQTPKEKQYKLFAVVYHDGKEASKGHYLTDAFHVGYSSWLRYDDATVKQVQEEAVLKPQGTRVPYLLFYRRSDTISRNK